MNYIQRIKSMLSKKLDIKDDLLDLYSLLVLVKGTKCTLEDVHDAWAVWQNKYKSDHKSLIPFENLSPEVQGLDREYTEAIVEVARELYK